MLIVETERIASQHRAAVNCPPTDSHNSLVAYAATAQKRLTVFGATVEAVLLPDRAQRAHRATAARPAFARSPAARILAEESFWHDDELVLTPNKYPFCGQQRLLWPRTARREPDGRMWTAACAWSDAIGGTALVNTIGAAATIAWTHAHLTPERLAFLGELPELEVAADLVDLPPGVNLVQKDLPVCLLGVRGGDAAARGEALAALTVARLTPCWNVCIQDRTAWLFPRRTETPSPHFPYPLGAAELWGRWCFGAEQPFRAATGRALEQALIAAGAPSLSGDS